MLKPMITYVPSLDGRKEPPNSKAVVIHYDATTKRALVLFKGETYTARSTGAVMTPGDSVSFVECPRDSYWIRHTGISWYKNKLSNWMKHGHRAGAAIEYILRKNPKFSPFIVGEKDGEPFLCEMLGSFDEIDADASGCISLQELINAGGSEDLFNMLNTDGNDCISRVEWERYMQKFNNAGLFQDANSADGGGGEFDPTIVIDPGLDPRWFTITLDRDIGYHFGTYTTLSKSDFYLPTQEDSSFIWSLDGDYTERQAGNTTHDYPALIQYGDVYPVFYGRLLANVNQVTLALRSSGIAWFGETPDLSSILAHAGATITVNWRGKSWSFAGGGNIAYTSSGGMNGAYWQFDSVTLRLY